MERVEAEYAAEPEDWIGNGVPWRLLLYASAYGDVPPVCVSIPPRHTVYPMECREYASTKADFQAKYKVHNVGALTACDYKDPPIIALEYVESGRFSDVRRLMPRECLRLQGFPETWCDGIEPRATNADIYRMAGNAIALPVAEYVLSGLVDRGLPYEDTDVFY